MMFNVNGYAFRGQKSVISYVNSLARNTKGA